ncbi:translocation/assembly module TamB domain-containing protein [Psittacicella hinzii]|uniref:Translocation and assembly module TamB C-terminal domain-containing protein n=1 Tax=Psittacicella hinzii TaxID=2028575 RepID=A0A3A1YN42_9GAMM|nr:translocation/assembly module TamB domain-containing protein [Psittacicella hinzii]RIY38886.1 hypothetical protein CKF58_03180 [Psittacicella hinzii]
MGLKKVFKYAGYGLGGLVGVVAVGIGAIYYSSTLTTKVLNIVADKVPGLSWDKVEGSLASGITVTNLKYVSQNYMYNPQIAKPEDLPDSQEIPALTEVHIGQLNARLILGCLMREQLCLDQVGIKDIQVIVATGDDERLDHFNAAPIEVNENGEVEIIDTTNPNPEDDDSKNDWIDVRITNGKVENLEVIVGSNIGLQQAELNKYLVSNPQVKAASTAFVPTILNLGLKTPESIYNAYLSAPMHIKLDKLAVGDIHYTSHNYDLAQVTSGNFSYLQYSLDTPNTLEDLEAQETASAQGAKDTQTAAANGDDKSNQAAQADNGKGDKDAQGSLVQKHGLLPKQVKEFFATYFNLQADSYSQAFQQIKTALDANYQFSDTGGVQDFTASLPSINEDLEQEIAEASAAASSDSTTGSNAQTNAQTSSQAGEQAGSQESAQAGDNVSAGIGEQAANKESAELDADQANLALWQELTGQTTEFKFATPTDEGKELPASEVVAQVNSQLQVFRNPARETLLNGTNLRLPVDVTTDNVKFGPMLVGFYDYQAAPFLEAARKAKDLNAAKSSTITFNSQMQLEHLHLDGNLTATAANLKVDATGDLTLKGHIDYLARTQVLDAQIDFKAQAIPLVSLPFPLDLTLTAKGHVYERLAVTLANKAPEAQINAALDLRTSKTYWPLELTAQISHLEIPELIKLNALTLEAKGRINDMRLQAHSHVAYDKLNYTVGAVLVNSQQNLVADVAAIQAKADEDLNTIESSLEQRSVVHAYAELNYNKNIMAQVMLHSHKLDLNEFADTGYKDLTLNTFINLGGVYNSKQDWTAFIQQGQVKGTLEGKPFTANLQLGVDSVHGLIAKDVKAQYATNNLDLRGVVNTSSDLYLQAKVNNLSAFVPALKIDANVDLTVQGNLDSPSIKGTNSIKHLSYKTPDLNLNLQQAVANLALQVSDAVYGKANVSLGKSQVNDIRIDHVKVDYVGEPNSTLQVDVKTSLANLRGNIEHFNLYKDDVYGNLNIANLDLLTLGINGLKTSNAIESHYNLASKKAQIKPFTISNSQLSLSNVTPLEYTPEKVTGSLALNKLDLSMLNRMLREAKTRLQGQVAAKLNFTLNPSNLEASSNKLHLTAESKYINVKQVVDLSLLNIDLSAINLEAQLAGTDLNAQANLRINRESKLDTQVKVSDLYGAQNLSGKVVLDRLSLNIIKPLLDNTQQVSGNLSTDMTLGGTLKKPLLYGNAGIKQLGVAMVDLPFEVSAGEINLTLNGDQADIRGNLPTKSTPLVFTGNVDWADADNLKSQVNLTTQNLRLRVLDYGNVQLDSNIVARYDNNGAVVNGTANLHDGRFTVASSSSASYLGPTGDVVFVDNQGKPLTPVAKATKSSSSSNILAKLKVTLGKNLVFDAYGLNAGLTGALDVDYDGNPKIFGTINIPYGTFDQYGQNLIIQRGDITFNGLSVIPNIYLRAIRNPEYMMDNVTVGVQVSGAANKPSISLFSTPSNISDSQKLNYLLTGSASDTDDDQVGLQLFTSSLSSSLSIIQEIGNTFGIKNLQLSTAKSGEASQVTLSGTVLKRVRLNYAYGLFNGLTEISASYRLLPKIFLRLSHGTSSAIDAVYSTSW